MEKPLFEKRITARISALPFYMVINGIDLGGRRVASWPFSKIQLFKNYLILKILGKEFRIEYKNINEIRKEFPQQIRIDHHEPSIEEYVEITGLGTSSILLKKLKEVIQREKLPLKVEP